jgi:L-aminopeptidase/D-esterase-like protein
MPWDGDTIFSVSTGEWAGRKRTDVGIIGALAADAMSIAILRGVLKAKSWGDYPAASSYKPLDAEI